ncbi:fumarylacetoacetate (FAA) hydrolase [Mesorhizobium sp. 131-2-1]|nr:fumarylacetoacetate (FAA) hydrolase [Mesorhizobium sp. 131-2-1]
MERVGCSKLNRSSEESRRHTGPDREAAGNPPAPKKSRKDQARERNPDEEFQPWRGTVPGRDGQGLPIGGRAKAKERGFIMLISQILDDAETIRVVARNGGKTRIINGARSVYSLAMEAARTGTGLVALIERKGFGETVDLDAVYKKGRLVSPINHPDPAHLHLTGTGLTHLGSAATRDSMHKKLSADGEEQLTDSMKMFRMGLEGGKPAKGQIGVQPEWFYKGNGTMAVAPGAALMSPAFAQDAGEEPEIAGIYVIGDDGAPFRVGFTLSNEFSDHVTERVNYLFLAHSKLRNASFGPEILIGDLPADIRGSSRILRDGKLLWEKPFLSGEANMSHTIANLEHHHFKYSAFRQPGDVHVHMFGTATLSFADGVKTEAGDTFEIEAKDFGLPLRNPLEIEKPVKVAVKAL